MSNPEAEHRLEIATDSLNLATTDLSIWDLRPEMTVAEGIMRLVEVANLRLEAVIEESTPEMDPKTAVHHAIIDLLELYDYEDVDLSTIMAYVDLPQRQIEEIMQRLETEGIIKMNKLGEITMAKNEGYFPTTLQSH